MDTTKINQALEVLRNGGVVAIPTDTSYALAADATNPVAVQRVFAIKGRRSGKALSWFFSDINQIKEYAKINNYQLTTINSRLPAPYTFIVPASLKLLLRRVSGEASQRGEPAKDVKNTIGVRISTHQIPTELASKLGRPITATSANRSGGQPAYSPAELKNLNVDFILDGGQLPPSQSSTVIDLTTKTPRVIRRGAGEWEN